MIDKDDVIPTLVAEWAAIDELLTSLDGKQWARPTALPGWTVQVLEQLDNNILIRPLTLYTGPGPRDYTPISARG